MLLSALVIVSLLVAFCPQSVYERPGDEHVWTTPTGERYHRQDCDNVHNNTRKLTISAAEAAGYTPCRNCHPEVYLIFHYAQQLAFIVLGIALLFALPFISAASASIVLWPFMWIGKKIVTWWKGREE